ncbi:DUF4247 domain-containing protein [Corynebacterium hindlerae]|uniref:DUF4247 domain-containing protein n=1 Tax=Corynebacterium hindlerae TaxID=699041 RepID=A0A7G5FD81_9CORY|nr:DUF4247 domain-containing protein [Corynebacterium hindlerae]QMV84572.1 DUF4247 domain-containing protein [Corynebacterium hindlerae]
MSSRMKRKLGALFLVIAVVSFAAALIVGTSPKPNTYSRYGTYSCEGNVQQVADQIAAEDRPQARQFDPKTGTEYLKYRKRVVTVYQAGPTNCEIRVEDLRRYNDGTFVWLGPGFTPSSPSHSSGGSSGSGGSGSGVK